MPKLVDIDYLISLDLIVRKYKLNPAPSIPLLRGTGLYGRVQITIQHRKAQ
jgi:hypothetical protein